MGLPEHVFDDRTVVFSEQTETTGRDLLLLSLDSRPRVTPLLQTKYDERNAMVSPNGRWLAYDSDGSATREVHVKPFPGAGVEGWPVSTSGGAKPLWSRDGTELFFVSLDGAILRMPIDAKSENWSAGSAEFVLDARRYYDPSPLRSIDVTVDGRFVMVMEVGSDAVVRARKLCHFSPVRL